MKLNTVFPAAFGYDFVQGDWQTLIDDLVLPDIPIAQTAGNLHTMHSYRDLTQDVERCATSYALATGICETPLITQMWINRFQPRVTIHPHLHSNTLFSCVMYLDDYSAGTVFYSNDPKNLQSSEMKQTEYTQDTYTVDGVKNRIVFFPSNIRHVSQPCEGVRHTLSANFTSRELGRSENLNLAQPN
jgi:hypothetical protein